MTPKQEFEEWKQAIDDELILSHLGTADSYNSAKEALHDLCKWHEEVGAYFARESSSRWIRCSERMPTEADADLRRMVFVYYEWNGHIIMDFPFCLRDFSQWFIDRMWWMPTGLAMPNPPEIEEDSELAISCAYCGGAGGISHHVWSKHSGADGMICTKCGEGKS